MLICPWKVTEAVLGQFRCLSKRVSLPELAVCENANVRSGEGHSTKRERG
jgi:hypothetical protein